MEKSIHDLVAFRRAVDLVVDVYAFTANFPKEERYGLTAQVRRASVSVVADIAEGQGRCTYGEWRQLLSQARGSLYEVEAEVLLAERLGFATTATIEPVRIAIKKTGKALAGLLEWVQDAENKKKKRPSNLATKQPSNPAR